MSFKVPPNLNCSVILCSLQLVCLALGASFKYTQFIKMGLCNIALDLLTAICPFMQELKKLA